MVNVLRTFKIEVTIHNKAVVNRNGFFRDYIVQSSSGCHAISDMDCDGKNYSCIRDKFIYSIPSLLSLIFLGCNMLLYPGAFNMTTGPLHWELLARSRANDLQLFMGVISPARGHGDGYIAWGHSTLVDPWGKIIARAGHDDELLVADVGETYFIILLTNRQADNNPGGKAERINCYTTLSWNTLLASFRFMHCLIHRFILFLNTTAVQLSCLVWILVDRQQLERYIAGIQYVSTQRYYTGRGRLLEKQRMGESLMAYKNTCN